MSEQNAGSQLRTLSQADIEATLRDLLLQFRDTTDQSPERIARVARAGAEALLTQMQHDTWLNSAESATVLDVPERTVRERVEQQIIPAARDSDNQPAIHRRDLSLYQVSQRLGGTEAQVKPLIPPVAWSRDLAAWDLDPWDVLTPG